MKYLLLAMTLAACDGAPNTNANTNQSTCNTDNETCGPSDRGCGGESVDMVPGSDCLACHTQGLMPREDEADKWYSVAGTVFDNDGKSGRRDVTVRVTDSMGTVVEMTSSRAGNFYSRNVLVPPLDAEIEVDGVVSQMQTAVNTGACNTCHSCEGAAGAKIGR